MRILGTTLAWPLPTGRRRLAWPGVARAVALLLLALPLAACDFLTGIPSVERVELSVAPTTIAVNQTARASATPYGKNNSPIRNPKRAIAFRSSNAQVASINASTGEIIALTNGTTDIIAESGGKSASVTLTVRPVPVKQVIIAQRNPTLRRGVPFTFTAVAVDSVNQPLANRPITWRVVDAAIADVSPAGIVTPKAVGTTQIIASADEGKVADTTTIRVTEIPLTSAILDPVNPVLYVQGQQQFTVTLRDSTGATVTGRPITWLVDSPLVLGVENGLVRALAPGSGNVIARVEQVPGLPALLAASAPVTVLPRASAVSVIPATLTLKGGNSANFTVYVSSPDQPAFITGQIISVSPTLADAITITPPAAEFQSASGGTTFNVRTTAVTSQQTGTITFQALDRNRQPQGNPATVTITVNP